MPGVAAQEQELVARSVADERLGLAIAPSRMVQPLPGRLVLFPSYLWHGTVPFEGGERLTIAFDVRPPL